MGQNITSLDTNCNYFYPFCKPALQSFVLFTPIVKIMSRKKKQAVPKLSLYTASAPTIREQLACALIVSQKLL